MYSTGYGCKGVSYHGYWGQVTFVPLQFPNPAPGPNSSSGVVHDLEAQIPRAPCFTPPPPLQLRILYSQSGVNAALVL